MLDEGMGLWGCNARTLERCDKKGGEGGWEEMYLAAHTQFDVTDLRVHLSVGLRRLKPALKATHN